MSLDFLSGALVGGGVAALIAWHAGIREGMIRAGRIWRGGR